MVHPQDDKFVHKLFTTIADHYDVMNSLMTLNRDKYWRNCAIREADLRPDNIVLDVCCGTGKLTFGLAEQVPNGKVIGVDFCEAMLNKAQKALIKAHHNKRITIMQANALALPFDDNTFDCVITAFGLRNLPNVHKPIAEMYRVVRPGGKVISLELAKPSAPVFKHMYYAYFEKALPLLGKLKLGKSGFYSWLPQSLKDYPHQQEIAEIFIKNGLHNVQYKDLTGGIASIHVGVK